MKTEQVLCAYCENYVCKPLKEVTRSRKRGRKFFCGLSCASLYRNIPRRAKVITKQCPECNTLFSMKDTNKATTYCSVQCANANKSNFLTEEGREAQRQAGLTNKKNLLSTAEILKIREAEKYIELERHLCNITHEFEYALDGFVFDLYLPDANTLIEFDGRYHKGKKQQETDNKKNITAHKHGHQVIRILTDDNPIPFAAIKHTLPIMGV